MALNKRQKVGIGILALGLAALVVDRAFVLPESAPAGQAGFTDDYTIKAMPESIATPAPVVRPAVATVAQKLEAAWSNKDLSLDRPRNLFALPESWQQKSDPGSGGRPLVAATRTFAGGHKLEAIIVDPRGKHALIDDRLYEMGQELDGFELVAINRASVTFERNREQVELKLTEAR